MMRFCSFMCALAIILVFVSPAHAKFETDCVENIGEGYSTGQPTDVTYVLVDMGVGKKKVSTQILGALYQMYLAAQADGITLKLVSGFRTLPEQQHLYDCWQDAMTAGCGDEPIYEAEKICPLSYCPAGCGSCNLAAEPKGSNHQAGLAVDIHTDGGTNAAYVWLSKNNYENSEKFEFFHILSEKWHFNYNGNKPWADPCGGAGAVWQGICIPEAVNEAKDEIFKDMPPNSMGKEEAEALLAAGITKGCAVDLYCPNCVTTRAMAVTLLLRAANIEVGGQPANPSFVDLQEGAYYVPYVEKAKALGIIHGCDGAGTKFCPNDPTKRSEFAKMLIGVMGVPTVDPGTAFFDDVKKGYWAYVYIETLKELCITEGCTQTTFCPEDSVTRAEAAIFIVRAFDLLNENDCVSYCDDDTCEASSYCEPWDTCAFGSQCAEAGTQKRTCHGFSCSGVVTDASCKDTASDESQSCNRDTDGDVVFPWGEWSACIPNAKCATEGTQTKVRTVCKAGAEFEKTETQTCEPPADPDCAEVPEPDTSDAPDTGEDVTDSSSDLDAKEPSNDVQAPPPGNVDGTLFDTSLGTTQPGVPSGCTTGRSGSPLGWLGLFLMALWITRKRTEAPGGRHS